MGRRLGIRTSWPAEREQRLRVMAAEGLNARAMASVLGCTRNAVLGAFHRMRGYVRPLVPTKKNGRPVRKRTKSEAAQATHAARRAASGIPRMPSIPTLPMPPEQLEPETPRITSILELTSQTCHWPIGEPGHPDFGYCGGQTEKGSPYCAGHGRRAWGVK